MQENQQERTEHLKTRKKKAGLLPYFLVVSIIAGSVLLYFAKQHLPSETESLDRLNADSNLQTSAPHANVGDRRQELHLEPVAPPEKQQGLNSQSGSNVATDINSQENLSTQPPLPSEQGEQAGTFPTDHDPEQAVDAIKTYYQHLDQQPYLAAFHLDAPSQVYFSRLIQKLLDNPPLVSGETNDLFSILQNTAHFFRIVGRDNILAIKAIISQEKASFEEILADFYILSKQSDSLKNSFSIQMKEDSLCDYAGFFLSTMGGRLYLFRRDQVLRMLVSYYSILIVDEANQLGRNRHGIDIGPVVDGLINEIENSGNQLKLKEHYLDNLYRIKEG